MDEINVNGSVWVKLTDAGWQIRAEEFKKWAGYNNWHLFPEVTDDWQHFQLWELMQVFGPHIYMGMIEPPFVKNCVRLADPAAVS